MSHARRSPDVSPDDEAEPNDALPNDVDAADEGVRRLLLRLRESSVLTCLLVPPSSSPGSSGSDQTSSAAARPPALALAPSAQARGTPIPDSSDGERMRLRTLVASPPCRRPDRIPADYCKLI
jgi:hypothetical protein